MKTHYSYTALLNFKTGKMKMDLFLIFLITMGTFCTGQKEDNENFAGSSKRDDICQLLSKADIQSVFALSDEIEQKETKNAVCSYKWHNLQNVSGVGDKASWSDLGGGQLRVAFDGSIFYVSLTVTVLHGEDDSMDTQAMIDKTSALAKKVIKRM